MTRDMLDIIFACALAWCVVADAVLALIISNLLIRTRRTESLRSMSGSSLKALELRLDAIEHARSERTPTALQARVEDLAATVDAIQISNRKFQQRVSGWIGAERSEQVRRENVTDVSAPDDEIAALLALQTAPPARPGG